MRSLSILNGLYEADKPRTNFSGLATDTVRTPPSPSKPLAPRSSWREQSDWTEKAKLLMDKMRVPSGPEGQGFIMSLLHHIDEEKTKEKTRLAILKVLGPKFKNKPIPPGILSQFKFKNMGESRYLNSIPYPVFARILIDFITTGGYTDHTPNAWSAPKSLGIGDPPGWKISGTLRGGERLDPSAEIRRAVLGLSSVEPPEGSKGLVLRGKPVGTLHKVSGNYTEPKGSVFPTVKDPHVLVGILPASPEGKAQIRKEALDKIKAALDDPSDPAVDIAGKKYYVLVQPYRENSPHVAADAAGQNVYELTVPSMYHPTPSGHGQLPTTSRVDVLRDELKQAWQTRANYKHMFMTDKSSENYNAFRRADRQVHSTIRELKKESSKQVFPKISPTSMLAKNSDESLPEYLLGLARAKDLRAQWGTGHTNVTLLTVRGGNFDEFVTRMQEEAWNHRGAAEVRELLRKYYDEKHAAHNVRTLYGTRAIRGWTYDDEQQEKKLWVQLGKVIASPEGPDRQREKKEVLDKFDQLYKKLGIENTVLMLSQKAREEQGKSIEQVLHKKYFDIDRDPALRDKIAWYAWLIAAENAYGIRIEARKKMRPGHVQHWGTNKHGEEMRAGQQVFAGPADGMPIRIQRTGKSGWDTEVFRGVGIHSFNMDDLTRLVGTHHKFKGSVSSGIPGVFIVATGDLHRYGVDPDDMGPYLSASGQQQHQARKQTSVLGLVGNQQVIRNYTLHMHIFQFNVPENPTIKMALVPAEEYLLYFDSPLHGGHRLVHGMTFPGKQPDQETKDYAQSRYAQHQRQYAQELNTLKRKMELHVQKQLGLKQPLPPPVRPQSPPTAPLFSLAANQALKQELQGHAEVGRNPRLNRLNQHLMGFRQRRTGQLLRKPPALITPQSLGVGFELPTLRGTPGSSSGNFSRTRDAASRKSYLQDKIRTYRAERARQQSTGAPAKTRVRFSKKP